MAVAIKGILIKYITYRMRNKIIGVSNYDAGGGVASFDSAKI